MNLIGSIWTHIYILFFYILHHFICLNIVIKFNIYVESCWFKIHIIQTYLTKFYTFIWNIFFIVIAFSFMLAAFFFLYISLFLYHNRCIFNQRIFNFLNTFKNLFF